jgi:hypothetical protein
MPYFGELCLKNRAKNLHPITVIHFNNPAKIRIVNMGKTKNSNKMPIKTMPFQVI